MKNSLFVLLLCMVFISCTKDKEPEIDYIKVVYCTPIDLSKSLPLEIVNTADGWQVISQSASYKYGCFRLLSYKQ